MFTLALCDDDPYFLDQLQQCVKRYMTAHDLAGHCLLFTGGEALLQAADDFDIAFMDLQLPGLGGLEVVKALRAARQSCPVIFITAHAAYALEAFALDAVHYLLKPISDEAVFHALDKAFQWARQSKDKTLLISRDGSMQRIFLRDILYCEAADHKIYIHTNAVQYAYFGTLESLREKLDKHFFQCHRSFIVNLTYVLRKDRDTVTLVGGASDLSVQAEAAGADAKAFGFFPRGGFVMDALTVQTVLFYLWWALYNGFMCAVEFGFLLRFANAQGRHLAIGFSYVFVNCVFTVFSMCVQLPGVWRECIHIVLLAACALILTKYKPLRVIAPVTIVFTLYTFVDGLSAVIMRLLATSIPSPRMGAVVQIALSLSLAVLFYYALRLVARGYQDMAQKPMAPYLYILLLPCAFIVWITRLTLGLNSIGPDEVVGNLAGSAALFGFICILGACLSFFVILQVFAKVVRLSTRETEQALLQDQLREQQRYLAEAGKRDEQAQAFLHDVNSHLSVLAGLIHARDLTGASQYFDKLNMASGALRPSVASGHAVLDILLSEKLRYAEQNQIVVKHTVHVPAHLSVDDLDLCVLFSNPLDNAIKACLQLEPARREIQLTARVRHQFLVLELSNPILVAEPIIWGTGLKNTKQIVEKYQGSMELAASEGTFRISLLLCWDQGDKQPSAQ